MDLIHASFFLTLSVFKRDFLSEHLAPHHFPDFNLQESNLTLALILIIMATEALPTAAEGPVTNPAPANTAGDKPKKTKKKKTSKLHERSTHPTYLEMIGEAITSLKERTGSSQYAIAKFIEVKHKAHLPSNFSKVLLVQLRKFAASGKLTKVKNSYKLPATTKKPAVTAPTKAKKVALAKPKPKAGVATKPKVKAAVKPKPKKKVTVTVKPKAAVKVSKPKPKTVAAKPNRRPAKVAKTSAKDAPGKKVVAAKKTLAAPKTVATAAKTTRRASSGKSAAKVPAKKISTRKAK
ncbi:hypothetical protein IEQ34_007436 [Dendrobium chrysotoxum]|uniref:H15 domain-containing protein n=1 Tax=Dendrobium chrysotoxum TaxID=161865 RepID=A0AAV7H998_DENCH|nr:hypothetical protein IEQ34_007436 [Dendrobium chrysotoxum]